MTRSNRELDRIDGSWTQLMALVEDLGPGGLAMAAADGWTVQDHLVHIAAWERSLLALLEGRDRLAAMGIDEPADRDTDEINHAVRALHRGESTAASLAYVNQAHAQLMEALGRRNDADLQLGYIHYQPEAAGDPDDGRPVIGWVAGNTYEHYDEHSGWIDQLVKESRASR
jgi:hypothetical protein